MTTEKLGFVRGVMNDHIERLEAMAADRGETWDLTGNDQAAIKFALAELTTLRAQLAEYQGAMRAQDQREDAAGVRCGVLRGYSGCDWPDAVAEEVLTLRAQLEQAQKELAKCGKENCFGHEVEGCRSWVSKERLQAEIEKSSALRAELEQVRGAAQTLISHSSHSDYDEARIVDAVDLERLTERVPAPPSPRKEGT